MRHARTLHTLSGIVLILAYMCGAADAATRWRVEQSGAKGDGVTDDTRAIQRAIQHCYESGYRTLVFKKGKTYRLASYASQSSLVLYGSNLTIDGRGATLLDERHSGGYWGDTVRVGGLVDGVPYPMAANGEVEIWHAGHERKIIARNVMITNLTIRHTGAPAHVNSVGIAFADHVELDDVTSIHSPQSAFAILSDAQNEPTTNVRLVRTHALDSAYHAYRVSLQGEGNSLSVVLSYCSSVEVRNAEGEYAPAEGIDGLRAHLWYRAGTSSPGVSLTVEHCKFDDSAQVVSTQGSHDLKIIDTDVPAGLHLVRQKDDRVEISGNRLGAAR